MSSYHSTSAVLTCAVGGMLAVCASISDPATSPSANTRCCFSTLRFRSVNSAPCLFTSKGSFSFLAAWLAGELPAVHRIKSAGMVLLELLGSLTWICCLGGAGGVAGWEVLACAAEGLCCFCLMLLTCINTCTDALTYCIGLLIRCQQGLDKIDLGCP